MVTYGGWREPELSWRTVRLVGDARSIRLERIDDVVGDDLVDRHQRRRAVQVEERHAHQNVEQNREADDDRSSHPQHYSGVWIVAPRRVLVPEEEEGRSRTDRRGPEQEPFVDVDHGKTVIHHALQRHPAEAGHHEERNGHHQHVLERNALRDLGHFVRPS